MSFIQCPPPGLLSVCAVQMPAPLPVSGRAMGHSARWRIRCRAHSRSPDRRACSAIGDAELFAASFCAARFTGIAETDLRRLHRRWPELGKQPQTADQHRLMDQIEGEAVPSCENRWPRPPSEGDIRKPVEQPGRLGELCGGHSCKNSAEPGKQRNIVVRPWIDGRQTDPPPCGMIEERRTQELRRGHDR